MKKKKLPTYTVLIRTPAGTQTIIKTNDFAKARRTYAQYKGSCRLCVNFRRRLLYAYPEAKIVIYMGRGKNTHRIHAHMLTDGVPEEAIRKQKPEPPKEE